MPQVEFAQDGEWFPSELPEDRDDKGSVAVMGRFIWAKVLDIPKSKEKDREVYKKMPAIEHKARGHIDVSVTKITPDNSQYWVNRFPDAWMAFQGNDVEISGTPLTARNDDGEYVLEDMTPDRAKVLRLQGVRTLEELSTLSDEECQRMGFGYKTLRNAASAHLKASDAPKPKGRPKKDINAELAAVQGSQQAQA